jgi:hypothetical protein
VACSFDYLSCGEVVVASNENAGSHYGNPSGDRRYLVLATGRMSIAATTCLHETEISTSLTLHSTCPSLPSSKVLANQTDNYYCSILEYNIMEPGTYWLVVEGDNIEEEEGQFALQLTCTGKPSMAPSEQPTLPPTEQPTPLPTAQPTPLPTKEPTAAPTTRPTTQPTDRPTPAPTHVRLPHLLTRC